MSDTVCPNVVDGYVYFIYFRMNDSVYSSLRFIGKVGRGTGIRWKSYITPYGHGYTAAILRTPDYMTIENEVKQWGRKEGLIYQKGETIIVNTNVNDSIRMAIARYNLIVAQILDKISSYGEVIYLLSHDTFFAEDPITQLSFASLTLQTMGEEPHSAKMFLIETNDIWEKDIWYITSYVYSKYMEWCKSSDEKNTCTNNKFKAYAGDMIVGYNSKGGKYYYNIKRIR